MYDDDTLFVTPEAAVELAYQSLEAEREIADALAESILVLYRNNNQRAALPLLTFLIERNTEAWNRVRSLFDLDNYPIQLGNADLRGAVLDGADLSCLFAIRADFREADLEGANFAGSTLTGARFAGARVANACFDGCNLERADFTGCDLSACSMRDALTLGMRA